MNRSRQAQSVLDMALQMMGSCDDAVVFAGLNGLQITDEIPINREFRQAEVIDEDVVEYWNRQRKPATGYPLIITETNTDWLPGFPGMLPMMLG